MFDFLKKKLKDSAKKLAEKVSKEPKEKPKKEKEVKPVKERKEEKPVKPEKEKKEVKPKEKKPEKKGFLKRVKERVTERELSEKDIEDFFQELGMDLLQANVAFEVGEALKKGLKEKLAGKPIKRTKAGDVIKGAFEETLLEIVDQKPVDLKGVIKKAKSGGRPAVFLFLGFNGTGKSLSLAKFAKFLLDKRYKLILAAGDTFRSAGIEQLEAYAKPLGLNVIKHKQGADSCAVIFDCIKAAKAQGYDVVLADTAGRSHADVNLLDELKKIVRVNKPDLKILVLDSLAGSDICEQSRLFDAAVGVDALILTKLDVNKKGGAIFSARYILKKPILFLCTGQGYDDLEEFNPKKLVKGLLE